MINSRQQYDFVTIPATMRIDGGILPARDVAQSGVKVLRGEDPAFLLEALAERRFVSYPVAGLPAYTMDHVIRASRMQELCDSNTGLRGLISGVRNSPFCKPLPSGTPTPRWNLALSSTKVCDAYSLLYQQADLSCSPNDFMSGSPLKLDPIRKIFYDMQTLRTFEASVDNSTSLSSCSTYTAEGTGRWQTHRPPSPSSYEVAYYSARNYTDPDWVNDSYTYTRTVATGSFSLSLFPSVANYVSDGSLFGFFTIDCNFNHNMCIIPLPYTYGNGTLTTSADDVKSAANDVMSYYGHPWSSVEAMTCKVYLNRLLGLFTLGAHTDMSGINWNWTP